MVTMGLIKGRHQMPDEVKEYIFNEDVDPMDFEGMYKHVWEVLTEKLNVHIDAQTQGLQQNDYMDVRGFCGEPLCLYVTGLTSAAMAVVKFCAHNGCSLVLMHYDRDSGTYKPQGMWAY